MKPCWTFATYVSHEVGQAGIPWSGAGNTGRDELPEPLQIGCTISLNTPRQIFGALIQIGSGMSMPGFAEIIRT